jgi:hypothetical protein
MKTEKISRDEEKPKVERKKKGERGESREKRDAFPCSARVFFFFLFFFFFFYEFESDVVIEEELRKVCAFFLCVFVFVLLFVSFINIVNDKIRLEITTPSSSKTRREKKK